VANERAELKRWIKNFEAKSTDAYNTHLHRTGKDSALNVSAVAVRYNNDAADVNGSEIISRNFECVVSEISNAGDVWAGHR
jgi:hypothetical protein